MVCSGVCTLHSCETWPCSYGDQDLGEPRMVAADEDVHAREVTHWAVMTEPLTTTVAMTHMAVMGLVERKRDDPQW